MSRFHVLVCVVGVMVLAALGDSSLGACIVNGDFSISGDPLNPPPGFGWLTELAYGDPPTVSGGVAQFDVTDQSDTRQLEQTFTLPAGAQTLAFEFLLTTVPGSPGDQSALPDSFQATLYDASTFDTFPSGGFFPAFYSIDNSGSSPEFYDPNYVSVSSLSGGERRVTLDLSSLSSQNLLLDFSVFGSNDGLATQVTLDNVVLTEQSQGSVIPEPTSLALWSVMALVALALGRRSRRSRARSPVVTRYGFAKLNPLMQI
ncbi:MAG: hypothetical protein JJ992_00890 [Planctomycetes bacterium]|nr:hypothetical protein [Planctomycetota bacterium]